MPKILLITLSEHMASLHLNRRHQIIQLFRSQKLRLLLPLWKRLRDRNRALIRNHNDTQHRQRRPQHNELTPFRDPMTALHLPGSTH